MLIQEVKSLVRLKKLHPFDGLWIANLKPENQLAAAMKCIEGLPLEMLSDDNSVNKIKKIQFGSSSQDAS